MAIDVDTHANEPRKARGDNGEFEQHSLPDQIAADEYVARKAAADTGAPHRAIRFARIVTPGSRDR